MAESEQDEHPEEYSRPPAYYPTPLGGIVKVMERVFKQGETQQESLREAWK